MLPEWVRAALVCPLDHSDLLDEEGGFRCTTCKRLYPVRDGIPDFVPEDPPVPDGETSEK